jgi:hypothetical protein
MVRCRVGRRFFQPARCDGAITLPPPSTKRAKMRQAVWAFVAPSAVEALAAQRNAVGGTRGAWRHAGVPVVTRARVRGVGVEGYAGVERQAAVQGGAARFAAAQRRDLAQAHRLQAITPGGRALSAGGNASDWAAVAALTRRRPRSGPATAGRAEQRQQSHSDARPPHGLTVAKGERVARVASLRADASGASVVGNPAGGAWQAAERASRILSRVAVVLGHGVRAEVTAEHALSPSRFALGLPRSGSAASQQREPHGPHAQPHVSTDTAAGGGA